MSEHGPPPGARRLETVRVVRAELDAMMVRLGRLAQAGVMTSEHRAILRTISDELRDIRRRLRADPRGLETVDALGQVAEHVDEVANIHQGCVYGPVLTELSERMAAAKDLIS